MRFLTGLAGSAGQGYGAPEGLGGGWSLTKGIAPMAKEPGRKLADSLAYPPRAMRADRAAAYLSMSTSTFLELVEKGRLPKGKKLEGMRFWDRLALDSFVENYEGEPDEAAISEKWNKMLGAERKPRSKPWSSANSKSYRDPVK